MSGISTRMTRRCVLLFALLALAAAAVTARLVDLQILRHGPLAKVARVNAEDFVTIRGPRGEIVDRRGTILAISVPTKILVARPVAIPRAGLVALERAAGTPGRLTSRAERRTWIPVTQNCGPTCEASVSRLIAERFVPEDAVHLASSFVRAYPHGPRAAHLLGFVNRNGDAEGLELAYDDELRPVEQRLLLIEDARDMVLEARLAGPVEREPQALMLTIDLRIQDRLEAALAMAVRRHGASSARGVVLDPRTGEVLALANLPTFDPNDFGAGVENHGNKVIRDCFEPGSVMKPLTAVSILESGTIDPRRPVYCEQGRWIAEGSRRPVRDHHPYEWLTLPRVLVVSSNIGIAKYAQAIEPVRLEAVLRAFGIGARTGVDLPAEADGYINPHAHWRGRDRYAVAYGYTMNVTTLQLAVAYAALANGGQRIEPRVGRALARPGREWEPLPVGARERIASEGTVRQVAGWLRDVIVDADGTGTQAAVPGYVVAGKTGTAERFIDGRYDRDRNVATFAGFAPADRPRAVVVISVVDPVEDGRDAGSTAAPVFAEVMGETLRLLHIAPSVAPRTMAAAGAQEGVGG